VIKSIYDLTVRRFLPRKIGAFNGVPVRRPKLFDATDVRRGWEATFIKAVQQVVELGDHVVEVGGGLGVSTVYAARAVGVEGSVTVYEPTKEGVKIIKETAELSRMSEIIDIKNAAIGSVKDSFLGDLIDESYNILPSEIPDCDVLLLDCEGAELEILHSMSVRPRNMVIETHPYLGSTNAAVIDALPAGYLIESQKELEEESELEKAEGIRVLTVTKPG